MLTACAAFGDGVIAVSGGLAAVSQAVDGSAIPNLGPAIPVNFNPNSTDNVPQITITTGYPPTNGLVLITPPQQNLPILIPAPPGPPTNDDFGSPWLLTGLSADVVASNSGATAETNEPAHDGLTAEASVWFAWTAPYDGFASVTVLNNGSGIYWAAVYTGTNLANLELVSFGTIPPPAAPGVLLPSLPEANYLFGAAAGQTYHIAVDGHPELLGVLHGSFTLQLQLGTVTMVQPGFTNYAAGQAVPIDFETTDTNSPIAWLEAFAGTNSIGVAPNPPFSFVYQSSDTDLDVSISAVGTNTFGQRVVALPNGLRFRPSNDDFADATTIEPHTVTTNFIVHLTLATAESGEPPHGNGPAEHSVWWKWRPTRSIQVRFKATVNNEGFPIDVFTGTNLKNLRRLADNSATTYRLGWSGIVTLNAVAGTTYWIRVDDTRSTGGGGGRLGEPFPITFSLEPNSVPLPGEIYFSLYEYSPQGFSGSPNHPPTVFPLGRVYMPDGHTPLPDSIALGGFGTFVAQLWAGKTPQAMQPVSAPQSFFDTSTNYFAPAPAYLAGMFSPEMVILTNAIAGEEIFAQIRVGFDSGSVEGGPVPTNNVTDDGWFYGTSRILRLRAGSEETGPAILIGIGSFSVHVVQ